MILFELEISTTTTHIKLNFYLHLRLELTFQIEDISNEYNFRFMTFNIDRL